MGSSSFFWCIALFWRLVASFQRDTLVRHGVDLRSQRQIPSKRRICNVFVTCEKQEKCSAFALVRFGGRFWFLVYHKKEKEGKEKPEEERTDHKSSQSHKEQQCRGAGSEGTFQSFDVTWSMCGTCVRAELFSSSRPSHWHQTVFNSTEKKVWSCKKLQ